MSFLGKVSKAMSGINELATEKIGPSIGKVIKKGVDNAPGAIDEGAKIIDKSIKTGQKIVGKVKSGDIGKTFGKVSKAVLTDEDSYTHTIKMGNKGINWSNKPLVLDQLNSTVKSIGDRGAAAFDVISRDTTKGGRKNPFQLIEKSSDSMVGWKATTKGKLVAGAAMLTAGVPGGVKQYVNNRQGTNMDQQPVSVAPKVPAYANNGGATGDLVFALNNLRHGGMM